MFHSVMLFWISRMICSCSESRFTCEQHVQFEIPAKVEIRLTNLVDVVRDVEHGLVGLLDEVVLLVRRRRVGHQLAQDQVVLQDALNREDVILFSSWITLCGAIRFGTCLHGYGEEVPEPELALVGGQLALGHLVADAVVL